MDGDAIKKFFAQHVEKFILGLIAATAIFLIYTGTKYPNYLKEKNTEPTRLEQDAQRVLASIDDDHTEAIVETLPTKEEDWMERVAQTQDPIPADVYDTGPYTAPQGSSVLPRQDPELFAPVELRVHGVLGALAMKAGNRTSYPAMDLEDADPLEVEEEKRPRPSRTSRRGRGMEGGYGGEPGYGSEMMEGYGAEMEGYGAEMMGGPGTEMMGSYGSGSSQRRLNPKYNEGYKPTGVTGGSGMTSGPSATDEDAPLKSYPASSLFIAGTAAVPHKKLIESYKSALLDAAGYQAQRDKPLYAGYQVERADVTSKAVDELVEEDWVLVSDWETQNKIAWYQWDGFGAEIVPGDYRDPQLTAVIPPLLVYDFSWFVTHPLIPLKSLQEIAMEKQPQRRVEPTIEGPILPGRNNNTPPAAAPSTGGTGSGAMAGSGPMSEMGPMAGMGAGGLSGPLGDPEYKLVRFYDFRYDKENGPQPGRKYVYRVRIGVEDPNFPKSPRAQPPSRDLAGDVYERVLEKVKEFETTQERDYIRYSEWSDPSPVASLPDFDDVYAGPVEPAKVRALEFGGKSIEYVTSPPQGKAVGMRWDWTLATNLLAELQVMPGSVLNTKKVAEVIDPLTMVIKKTDERDIVTDVTVIDVVGGEPLEIVEESDEEEEMTAPGVMLLFDPDGGLSVRDDVDDLRGYRMHTFAEEREAPTAASGMGGGGYPGGEMGGYGSEMGGYGSEMGGYGSETGGSGRGSRGRR